MDKNYYKGSENENRIKQMSSFFYAGGSLSSAGAIKTGTESDRCVRRLCRVRPTFSKVCFRVVEFRYFGVLSANVPDVF